MFRYIRSRKVTYLADFIRHLIYFKEWRTREKGDKQSWVKVFNRKMQTNSVVEIKQIFTVFYQFENVYIY